MKNPTVHLPIFNIISFGCLLFLMISFPFTANSQLSENHPEILTPPSPPTPAIHGAKVFGVRPGSPFLFQVPATGDRPMYFSAKNLPNGLNINPQTGLITGTVSKVGEYQVVIMAKNKLGKTQRGLKIKVGEDISLAPAMGWNSWNCWGSGISQEKVLKSAKGFIDNHLVEHGWTYINIDDGWQGERDAITKSLQPNPKNFTNIKALCDTIHSWGLKIGIYSTPWVQSYAGRLGGSSENPTGAKDSIFARKSPPNKNILPKACGKYSFAVEDAKQWADWGIDYLKYDWAPIDLAHTQEMYNALRHSGRDIVLSLSNNHTQTLQTIIDSVSLYAQSWRTTTDINDSWKSMAGIGFNQGKWTTKARQGHYNDADMLVVGYVGWGKPHPSKLTPDEQYTHISLWALLTAPLLLGCDFDKMDDFTLSLITNDEVIDINQDPLCKQAQKVLEKDSVEIYTKPLEDGKTAVGIFNRSVKPINQDVYWKELGIKGKQKVRNVWRQKDIKDAEEKLSTSLPPHGSLLVILDEIN